MVGLVVLCLCGACAPCPLLLVGGRRCARGGGTVRAGDAGLWVVQERGLSPHTPVEAAQGCASPVVVDVRRRMGSSGLVDKQHGARREQVSAPPDLLASLLFLLPLPARQHPPGSGVRAAPPCVLCLCSASGWGVVSASAHEAPLIALKQGGGSDMCILAVVFFLGFIFRAGTCVNVQWARGAALGGQRGHRVLLHWESC